MYVLLLVVRYQAIGCKLHPGTHACVLATTSSEQGCGVGRFFRLLTPTPAVLKNRLRLPTPAVLKNRLRLPTPAVLKNRLRLPTPAVLKNRLRLQQFWKTDSDSRLQQFWKTDSDSRLQQFWKTDSDSSSFEKPTPTPAVLKNRLRLQEFWKTDSDSRLRLQQFWKTDSRLRLQQFKKNDSDSRLQLKTCDSTDSRLHNPGSEVGFEAVGEVIVAAQSCVDHLLYFPPWMAGRYLYLHHPLQNRLLQFVWQCSDAVVLSFDLFIEMLLPFLWMKVCRVVFWYEIAF